MFVQHANHEVGIVNKFYFINQSHIMSAVSELVRYVAPCQHHAAVWPVHMICSILILQAQMLLLSHIILSFHCKGGVVSAVDKQC